MKLKEKDFELFLDELKEIASRMNVKVRFERGDFQGGYCILNDSRVVVINKLSTLQRKVTILAEALKELGVEEIYIPPKLREFIEETWENG